VSRAGDIEVGTGHALLDHVVGGGVKPLCRGRSGTAQKLMATVLTVAINRAQLPMVTKKMRVDWAFSFVF
jgi:hypothetical protein